MKISELEAELIAVGKELKIEDKSNGGLIDVGEEPNIEINEAWLRLSEPKEELIDVGEESKTEDNEDKLKISGEPEG